jgi:hypothetical protein
MGQLRDVVSIRERPAEAEDRAVPGHWEGDLIRGTGGSAVGTLVERSSRLLMLVQLDKIDAETVSAALRQHVLTLPEHLRRSLTWDQGKGMGPPRAVHHRHLRVSTALSPSELIVSWSSVRSRPGPQTAPAATSCHCGVGEDLHAFLVVIAYAVAGSDSVDGDTARIPGFLRRRG